jgi:hypothetical protein
VQRFEPCLPRPAKQPPAGKGWIHEIKHDGFRIMAWRDGAPLFEYRCPSRHAPSRDAGDLARRDLWGVRRHCYRPMRRCVIKNLDVRDNR